MADRVAFVVGKDVGFLFQGPSGLIRQLAQRNDPPAGIFSLRIDQKISISSDMRLNPCEAIA